jgi:hypothetical protein
MILSPAKLTHYLLSRGLVSHDSVVDGDLMIVECSHRNRSFKVLRTNHPNYFVKQIRVWNEQSKSAWECEATCYRLDREYPGFQQMSVVLPAYCAHDSENYVLVLELLRDWESLAEYQQRTGRFRLDLAAQLGRMMQLYQRESGERLAQVPQAPFPRRIPWILSVHETPADQFESLSGANRTLLEIVQHDQEFCRLLGDLRQEWQHSALIHGDVKWDNVIVNPNGSDAIKLVDWELADLGDPRWDAGAVLQAYLSSWIFSMPMNGGAFRSPQHAGHPLDSIQPAIQAFWHAYADGFADVTRGFLVASLRYGAARMIQTAYEQAHFAPELSAAGITLLQTSLNILARPQEATESLLGM